MPWLMLKWVQCPSKTVSISSISHSPPFRNACFLLYYGYALCVKNISFVERLWVRTEIFIAFIVALSSCSVGPGFNSSCVGANTGRSRLCRATFRWCSFGSDLGQSVPAVQLVLGHLRSWQRSQSTAEMQGRAGVLAGYHRAIPSRQSFKSSTVVPNAGLFCAGATEFAYVCQTGGKYCKASPLSAEK